MEPTSKLQQLWQELHGGYRNTMQFNPISLSLFLFFFFFLLLKLLKNKKTSLNLPPSPPKLPIIGNLHQLGTLPHRSLASLSEKYGPLLLLKLGQSPILVVSSAKMAREVMKTHDINFSSRPKTTAGDILLYGCQDAAFAPYGEYWRQAKKICVLELFSVKRVQSFQYVRDEEVSLLIDWIRKSSLGGESVDLNKLFVSTSNNIVSRCVLGEKFEDEDGKSRFGDVSRRVMGLLTAFCVTDFFPSLGWIDVLRGFIGELKRTAKTMDDFFDKVIEEHKAKMGTVKQSDKKDFVDIMLQLQQSDMLDYHFSQDRVKGIILDMFVGGSDTTATGLEWTMVELMKNSNTMKKVQEEIRRIVGKKTKIEMNDIEKMEYMNCVIKESLRLHPPVAVVPRETVGSVNIEGYNIPSKTSVFVNAWAIQRDPEIWEKPNEFIPERFMNKSFEFHGQDYEFIPFGGGRRKCPGISFGIASFEYALANILYWFDWKIPDGIVMDLEEENGLAVKKKIPLHLKPIPYIQFSEF